MSLKLHIAAIAPAVTLAEAKVHLRVDYADEDALITSLVSAATLDAEHIMGRAVMPQKWKLSIDAFSSKICLDMPTVTAVDSIQYVNTSGALVTLSPSVYQVVLASDYAASIVPAYGQSWPAIRSQPEAVQIIFSTGYADAASVPELIKAWIKLRVGALYAQRESTTDRQTYALGMADSLLDRFRNWQL